MAAKTLERKLAAIFYADVAGYSRLTGTDEEGTHRRLSEYLDAISTAIHGHHGQVVHYAGDAVLADFSTVTDALSCAATIQEDLAARNQNLPDECRVQFRIGVNLGEVIVDRDDIYGDGVNVAARLESLADPGGICISGTVYDAIGNMLPSLHYAFMGEQSVKNIAKPVRAYRVVATSESAQTPPRCPYPGLVPFSAAEARYFYGRDNEIARMLQLLRRQRFLVVIGPSGSGKSSLVYAGLLPALERSRYFKHGYWLIRTMRPGPCPSEVLTNAIDVKSKRGNIEPGSVDALLKAHPPAERLLLLVDQFEEVFTQANRTERARFIAELQALRAPENCALILTLRADFFPDLMTSYLWPVDASQRVEVAPLRGEALRAAIEKPAAGVGVRIEESLVNQLLADAADEPGMLPLLQETMGLLWEEMEQNTLAYRAYQQLGERAGFGDNDALSGLAVAIAMKADATLAELNATQQAIARRIFLRLIQFGEGRADTRRQQPVSTLHAANDPPGEFERTLEHLTANRLLTLSGGDEHRPPAVDISHESLISGWSRLQGWVDERREAEQIRRRLESKAAEWIRLGQGIGGLLDEAELPEAERWLASPDATDLGFDAALPELVKASQLAIAEAEQAQEANRQRELAQAQALANEQASAARNMRRALIGLATVFLLAVGAALFAWVQGQKAQHLAQQEVVARVKAEANRVEAQQAKQEAERLAEAESKARAEAEARRAEAIAQLLLIRAPQQKEIFLDERSALLARQAYLLTGNSASRIKDQVDRVLRSILGAPYFAPKLSEDVDSVAASPSGLALVASTRAGNARSRLLMWDLAHPGALPAVLPGPTDSYIHALSFRPDGKAIAAGTENGALLLWDIERLYDPPRVVAELEAGISSLAFSPDAQLLAVGSKRNDSVQLLDSAGTIVSLEAETPATVATAPSGYPGGVPVTFSPDGKMLAAGSSRGTVKLWDINALTQPRELQGHQAPVWSAQFSPHGRYLASGDRDGVIRLWALHDEVTLAGVLHEHNESVAALAFSPDGATLASCSSDNTVRLWNLKNLNAPAVVLRGSDSVKDLTYTSDGMRLVSGAGISEGIRLWDLRPSGKPTVVRAHDGTVKSVAFSPNGRTLASGGEDGVVRIWDLELPDASPTVLRHDSRVASVAFSPDGRMLSSASDVGDTVRLWRLVPSIRELAVLPGHDPWSAPFSPDGKTLAVSGGDTAGNFVRLWNLDNLTGEPVIVRTPMKRWINDIAFSPDGAKLAATGREGIIHLEDLIGPSGSSTVLRGHNGLIWTLAFSPDSRTLATGGEDTTVRLWNLCDPATPPAVLGRHEGGVWGVRFSPDGKHLASSGEDGSVRLWDIENPSKRPALLYGHDGGVRTVAFSPDGMTLASGGQDGTYRLWDLNHPMVRFTVEELANLVCEKVWRNLTLDEWHQFIGEDIPYERTCPNLPIHPSLFEAAEKLAQAGDKTGAVALLKRALDLDPDLVLNPQEEVERLAHPDDR